VAAVEETSCAPDAETCTLEREVPVAVEASAAHSLLQTSPMKHSSAQVPPPLSPGPVAAVPVQKSNHVAAVQKSNDVAAVQKSDVAAVQKSNDDAAVQKGEEAGANNLCINIPGDGEYLAPEYILLGAEKAGSSSFSVMVATSGIVYPHNTDEDDRLKEFQVLKELQLFNIEDRFNKGLAFWLHHYPKCSRTARLVATDFTPVYISTPGTAQRINTFYGDKASQIKFGVIVRNPIARMLSAYHYNLMQRDANIYYCHDVAKGDFKDYVLRTIAGDDPCGLLSTGDYAKQLKEYFSVFSPSQFTIYPFKDIGSEVGADSLSVKDTWDMLGLAGGVPKVKHWNANKHPNAFSELGDDVMLQLINYVHTTMGARHVAEVLLSKSDQRPRLIGYTGTWELESVEQWLQANW